MSRSTEATFNIAEPSSREISPKTFVEVVNSEMVAIHAERRPIEGIPHPGPHQTYRNSYISRQERTLDKIAPDNIRLEMIYVGICGTDVHLLTNDPETGYVRSSAPLSIPENGRIIGHEGTGRVISVGANVRHIRPGDYVTTESILVCYHCPPCKRGNFNQCINAKLLGMEIDGVFGRIVDVPGLLAHDVTEQAKSDKDLRALSCIEPAAVAYVACENAKVKPGHVVVVFGGGPIGVLSAMMSKRVFGASEVHVVEPVPYRRELAKKWADQVHGVDEFCSLSSPNVDVVIEASGFLGNIGRIFRRVSPNGSLVLLARSGEALHMDHVDHMITNQISIVGSRGHLQGAFTSILNLYKNRCIDPGEIVTAVVSGEEGLCHVLRDRKRITSENCKVLARLGDF